VDSKGVMLMVVDDAAHTKDATEQIKIGLGFVFDMVAGIGVCTLGVQTLVKETPPIVETMEDG